jgi:hypothetical protein
MNLVDHRNISIVDEQVATPKTPASFCTFMKSDHSKLSTDRQGREGVKQQADVGGRPPQGLPGARHHAHLLRDAIIYVAVSPAFRASMKSDHI